MIDLDITENFMTQRYTESKKHFIQDKKQSYRLVSLDNILFRNNSKWINIEIIPLPMIFQKYYKELMFNIIDIVSHNIVLRILWLKKHDPQINQK